MNWQDAVAEGAKVAPAVAAALGGPAAGGITAGAARMVTGLLDVENSAQGLVAATRDPQKLAELQRLSQDHRRELERLRLEAEAAQAAEHTRRLAETQTTMRAELASDSTFKAGWRPSLGYIFALSLGGLAGVLGYTIAREPALVGDPEFTGLLIWLLATMGAALGINVRERTKDKARRLGESPGGFMDAIAKRLGG